MTFDEFLVSRSEGQITKLAVCPEPLEDIGYVELVVIPLEAVLVGCRHVAWQTVHHAVGRVIGHLGTSTFLSQLNSTGGNPLVSSAKKTHKWIHCTEQLQSTVEGETAAICRSSQ